MAVEPQDRWEHVRKLILGLFTKEEVKTPLSFYFKAAGYFTASLIAISYAPMADDLKWRLTILAGIVFLAVCLIVTIFGWFKPRNLVYGESGHRAERRMEFGTEKSTITREQYDALESVSNPKQLSTGEER